MSRLYLSPGYVVYRGLLGKQTEDRPTLLMNRTSLDRTLLDADLADWMMRAAVDGLEPEGHVALSLRRRGLVERAETATDPRLQTAIEALDAPFRWTLDALGPLAHELAQRALRAHAQRRVCPMDFWQLPVLPETAARRALLVHQSAGRDVLLVGDDDLVSVLLTALGHRVWVVDIDRELLRLIDRLSAGGASPAHTVYHDLRCPDLDTSLSLAGAPEAFDAAVVDPVYSRRGAELFLSRALALVRPGGQVFLAFGGYCSEILEGILANWRLSPRRVLRDFNHYYNPYKLEHDVITSDLYLFEVPHKLPEILPLSCSFTEQLVETQSWTFELALSADCQEPDSSNPVPNLDKVLAAVQAWWPEIKKRVFVRQERNWEAFLSSDKCALWVGLRDNRLELVATRVSQEPPRMINDFQELTGVADVRFLCFPRGANLEHECFARTNLWMV